jgi:hypothetical protein
MIGKNIQFLRDVRPPGWREHGPRSARASGRNRPFRSRPARRVFKVYALLREVHMTEAEVHARAILAGALIQSGSIDVNSANLAADWRVQPNTERLHHLVDLLYRAITETRE